MANCDNLITNEILSNAKDNADTYKEVIESDNLTTTTPGGKLIDTLAGKSKKADDAIAEYKLKNKGNYLDGPTLLADGFEYVRHTDGKDYFAVSPPYTTDPTTYPDPATDANLIDQQYVLKSEAEQIAQEQAHAGDSQLAGGHIHPLNSTEVATNADTDLLDVVILRSPTWPYRINEGPQSGNITSLDFSAGTATIGGTSVTISPLATIQVQRATDIQYLTYAIEGQKIEWLGYHEPSDGGSNWGIVKSGVHTFDDGHIFSISPTLYVEANLKGGRISIRKFGGKDDSTAAVLNTNNGPIVEKIVTYLSTTGGGEIYTPPVDSDSAYYGLSTDDETKACISVTSGRITMSGSGSSSVYKTYQNAHVPIHFCADVDITNPSPTGGELERFECHGFAIKGTGVYENFSLAKGRGILFRNTKNVSIHHMWIDDMSMIGVVSEGGDGYFRIQSCNIHGCKYGSINYNGRCYSSIIQSNICSGSNGDVNTLAIQATGPSTIAFNEVFGHITDYENCGGIAWGEGNYDGIGKIVGNTVKHCSFGIQAIFHGSCTITSNNLINCLTRGAIITSGTSTGAFTVPNSDNIVSENLIINCAPYGINCSAENTTINGNKIRNFSPVTNPSANTEPDWIDTATTQQGIRVRAKGCSVRNNEVSGCFHGLTTTILQDNGVIGGNNLVNNTNDYSLESATSGVFAATGHAIIERELSTPGVYRERIFRSNLPSQGYFNRGSSWNDPTPSIGQPVGQVVLFATDASLVTAAATAGQTILQLDDVSSWLGTGVGSIVGVELDNGTWHWTTLVSVSAPNITMGTGIPAGRSVNPGAATAYSYWRPLANLV